MLMINFSDCRINLVFFSLIDLLSVFQIVVITVGINITSPKQPSESESLFVFFNKPIYL